MGKILAIIGITTFIVGIVLLVLGAIVSRKHERLGELVIYAGIFTYSIFGIDFVAAIGYIFYAIFVFIDKVVA